MSDETLAKLAALEPLNLEFAAAIRSDLGYAIAMAAEGSRVKARAERRAVRRPESS